jgi:hypothetical protein
MDLNDLIEEEKRKLNKKVDENTFLDYLRKQGLTIDSRITSLNSL